MTQSSKKVRVAVVGASGYTGAELVRLLLDHPRAQLVSVTSRQHAGQPMSAMWPSLADASLLVDDEANSAEVFSERQVDTVFLALPHGEAAARVPALLERGHRVVDLSADFRLPDVNGYAASYHFTHPAPGLLKTAVYGLTEWSGAELGSARLLANPGCYATAILLSILPALSAGVVARAPIIVNAVSGVSGAGRAPKQNTHFVEADNSVSPYKVGESHQHLAEIKMCVARHAKHVPPIIFNPHLVPMPRGILASIVIPLERPLEQAEARALYTTKYAASRFVRILDEGKLPETRFVRGSNRCDLSVSTVVNGTQLLVFSAIDNLLKGAAGQAVQNWNRMNDWPEDVGLSRTAWGIA